MTTQLYRKKHILSIRKTFGPQRKRHLQICSFSIFPSSLCLFSFPPLFISISISSHFYLYSNLCLCPFSSPSLFISASVSLHQLFLFSLSISTSTSISHLHLCFHLHLNDHLTSPSPGLHLQLYLCGLQLHLSLPLICQGAGARGPFSCGRR